MNENQSATLADGRTIGFADYGAPDGAPIFALHGTPGSRIMFQLIDRSARETGLRVLAPERPGYGLSSRLRGRSLSDWARDISELADGLAIDRFAVVGVSGGGPYAAACAAQLSDRVSHCAFVSPIGPISHPKMTGRLTRHQRRIFVEAALSEWRARAMFRSIRWSVRNLPTIALSSIMRISPASDKAILSQPQIAANLLESTLEGLRPGLRGAVQDLRLYAEPWDFEPESISVPCRLWQGDADTTVPVAASHLLAEIIPDCTLTRIPGAGHYWVYEHYSEVLAWLAEPAGRARAKSPQAASGAMSHP